MAGFNDFLNDVVDAAREVQQIGEGAWDAAVGAEYPVNTGTLKYDQEGFYSWRIFGSPYMLIDDPSMGGVSKSGMLGEWYINQLRDSQLLTIKVGIPKYTGNKKRVGILDYANQHAQARAQGTGAVEATIDSVLAAVTMNISGLDNAQRNYIFYNQYEMYIAYVRLLIISMASYLGITNFPLPEVSSGQAQSGYTTIAEQDWSTYTTFGHKTNSLRDMVTIGAGWGRLFDGTTDVNINQMVNSTNSIISKATANGSGESFYDRAGGPPAIVQFMINPVNATDSFGNSTSKSAAEGIADSTQAIGKEISWLTSVGDTSSIAGAISSLGSGAGSMAQLVQSGAAQVSGDASVGILGSSIVGMLRGLSGERMIFPKIYDDSTFSKSANYTIKLTSPQGDLYSYFMNVGLPLCFLIPMVAPKTASTNAYKMPFLVQAYVTGQNAMPMAIVENLSITRGAPGAANKWGLPLEVEVTITIGDLYQNLAVSAIHDAAQFLSNECLIEYIASYTHIDTWNKSKVNQILGDIASDVYSEAFDITKIADRATYNLGEYLGNELRLWGIADSAR